MEIQDLDISEYLDDPEVIAEYLNATIEENDPAFFSSCSRRRCQSPRHDQDCKRIRCQTRGPLPDAFRQCATKIRYHHEGVAGRQFQVQGGAIRILTYLIFFTHVLKAYNSMKKLSLTLSCYIL